MFKHLKNFLIAIVLTFSFIGSVNAYTFSYQFGNDDIERINTIWEYLDGKTMVQAGFDSSNSYAHDNSKILKKEDYPLVFATVLYDGSGSNTIDYQFINNIENFSFEAQTSDFIRYKLTNLNEKYSFIKVRININTNEITGKWGAAYYSNVSKYLITIDKGPYAKSFLSFDLYNGNTKLLDKSFDYENKPTIFNFHLNGGHGSCIIGMHTPVIPLLYDDENFSISTDDYDIYDVLDNLEIEKDNMIFDGFYYDSNFTQPFNINDNFDEHATVGEDAKVINLYAKYRYKTVDDFLANTNFTTYTFDTNYDYAIINRGNNSDIVYMALPFSSYNLEVYEYQENTGTYKNGSSVCLVPIFNKGGWYMYELNTLFTNNQEVLILPRYLFDELDPNSFEDPNEQYHFQLTSNAYVTYTNDLTHVTITNSQGQTVDTNLQNSFELSQQYQEMYAYEKDIYAQIKIFLNNLTRYTTSIRQLFEYLFNSLNSTIRNFIIFIVVIILISAILRAIRRG